MSLQTRLADLITAIGTDYKQLRTWLTGSSTGDLTSLTTTDKTSLVAAINEVDADIPPPPDPASETVQGIIEIATQVETDAGTDNTRAITPLKFETRMVDYAQPLSTNLTTLAGVTSGSTGRSLLEATTAAGAKTTLGLADIATSGSASDITGGTLPSSVLPALAITDVFPVASELEMTSLNAQRGDVAVRSDISRTFILTTDDPSLAANWSEMTAGGEVLSVAGKTGVVTLAKGDVGLGNVDNTSDANKPVSTAQANADDLRLLKTANLSDLANTATARTNLSVYSRAELGNPETDLVAQYNLAKA